MIHPKWIWHCVFIHCICLNLSSFQKALMSLRPFNTAFFFTKITEPIPLKLSKRHRASQLYFFITYPDYFPVTATGTRFYVYFLPYTKWVWLKKYDIILFHRINCPLYNKIQILILFSTHPSSPFFWLLPFPLRDPKVISLYL